MKSSVFSTSALKICVLVVSITCGFAGLNRCDAQTIVGKWKRSGTKFFVKDKATGEQVPASAQVQEQYDQAEAARGYNEVLEIKPDNTYTSTVSTSSNPNRLCT